MKVFIPEPFTVSEIFASYSLLEEGEEVESFERQQLKEGIDVLAHKNGEQTRGRISNIRENTAEIRGKEIAIKDIMFIII